MNETWWVNPKDLDEKQKDILTEPPESEMLILGPPGSGKTNILLLRGNYVKSVAPRILLITFTRTLAEFIKSGPSIGKADQIQRSDVRTFMSWARELLMQNGYVPLSTNNFDSDRHGNIALVNQAIAERNIGKLYDVIFIDEVQDFIKSELEILRKLSHRLNASGDSRQRIYNHREGIPTITSMVQKIVTLENHYRIGKNICTFADQIFPPGDGEPHLIDGSKYDEELRESSVAPLLCADRATSYHRCIENIKEQIRYISDEPIGVLAPKGNVRDEFWEVISNDPELAEISILQSSAEYQAFGPNSQIRVMTASSSKGCEFRAVHILNAEHFDTAKRELAFTAVTRAKTELMLYHVQPLAGHMIPPGKTLPDLNSVF